MNDQQPDVVTLEIPSWFSRQRGTREKLRQMVDDCLAKDKRRIVVKITDSRRFLSMDVGILIGVWRMVRDADGKLAVACENELLQKLPLFSAGDGLPVFSDENDAIQFVKKP